MSSVAMAPDENPLRLGMRRERIAEPCIMVIFGASGDLSRRKLMPALASLSARRLLPPEFTVLGVGRTSWSDEQFRQAMQEAVAEFADRELAAGDQWKAFAGGLMYQCADLGSADVYGELARRLADLDRIRGTGGNRVFYLAMPPSMYAPIIGGLGEAGLGSGPGTGTRIIIEKPFGRDLASAQALNRDVNRVFDESQVYRIDHYLGKETVQNLLVFRFANAFLEPTWNRQFIDHVQISVAEDIGIGDRGGYYEEAGVLRDMFQNHLLQLLCLVAMEAPVAFEADAVRDEKVKVLRAVRSLDAGAHRVHAVRGQYVAGQVLGRPAGAYRDAGGVHPASVTPTYAALKLHVDNWRWQGVPFYLRSGKQLARKTSEISVVYRQVPHLLFGGVARADLVPNVISLRIQPDEGIALSFEAKRPGTSLRMRPVEMDFSYGSAFGLLEMPNAYERLLLDCMLGDSTLFTRRDEVEAAWRVLQPVLDAWDHATEEGLEFYESGTWGPAAADDLLRADGRRWRRM